MTTAPIIIDRHGQAWIAGPYPEPLDLSPAEIARMLAAGEARRAD